MNVRIQRLLSCGGIVAIFIAGFLLQPTPGSTRSRPRTVKDFAGLHNDIGGVVSSSKGTRSRRLGHRRNHRPSHALYQGGGHRRSWPLPNPGRFPKPDTPSGRAATGWSIHPKSRPNPANWSTQARPSRPTPKTAAQSIPPIIGIR